MHPVPLLSERLTEKAHSLEVEQNELWVAIKAELVWRSARNLQVGATVDPKFMTLVEARGLLLAARNNIERAIDLLGTEGF